MANLNTKYEDKLSSIGVELNIDIDYVETLVAIYDTVGISYPAQSVDSSGFVVKKTRNYQFIKHIHAGSNTFIVNSDLFTDEETFNMQLVANGDPSVDFFFAGLEDKEAAIEQINKAMVGYIRGIGLMEQTTIAGMSAPDSNANVLIQKNEKKARRRIDRAKAILSGFEVKAEDVIDSVTARPIYKAEDPKVLYFYNYGRIKSNTEESASHSEV